MDILDSKEILIKDNSGNTIKIEFADYLRKINHNNEDRIMNTSWILLNYPSITLDEFGYPLEKNAITLLGDWSEAGVASFLPKYYGIEKTE